VLKRFVVFRAAKIERFRRLRPYETAPGRPEESENERNRGIWKLKRKRNSPYESFDLYERGKKSIRMPECR